MQMILQLNAAAGELENWRSINVDANHQLLETSLAHFPISFGLLFRQHWQFAGPDFKQHAYFNTKYPVHVCVTSSCVAGGATKSWWRFAGSYEPLAAYMAVYGREAV